MRDALRRWSVAALGWGLAGATGWCADPIRLMHDGRTVARYAAGDGLMKPYVQELFSPAGVQVLLDAPPDHVHHHGLMFALGVDGADFWAEVPANQYGRQVARPDATRVTPDAIEQRLDWIGPDGRVLLAEHRTVTRIPTGAGQPHLLAWESELRPAAGRQEPVRLWGRHYFGLGLRLVPDLNGDQVTWRFPAGTPDGRLVRGDERVRPAAWAAAGGRIGGKPVTVAMWGDPRNERHPARWFTMTRPFSYLAATLDLEHQPRLLKPGESLVLRYGVAVFDGTADAAAIVKAIETWSKSNGTDEPPNPREQPP